MRMRNIHTGEVREGSFKSLCDLDKRIWETLSEPVPGYFDTGKGFEIKNGDDPLAHGIDGIYI